MEGFDGGEGINAPRKTCVPQGMDTCPLTVWPLHEEACCANTENSNCSRMDIFVIMMWRLLGVWASPRRRGMGFPKEGLGGGG